MVRHPYLVADNKPRRLLFDVVLELQATGSNDHVHLCVYFDGPFLTDTFFARMNAGPPSLRISSSGSPI